MQFTYTSACRTLGVSVPSTMEEVTKRYKFLCHAYHPDRFGDSQHKESAEEEFKKIKAAYEWLRSNSEASSKKQQESFRGGQSGYHNQSKNTQRQQGFSNATTPRSNRRGGWHRLWLAI